MIHPCLTPLSILKHSLSPPFTLTQAKLITYILLIQFKQFSHSASIKPAYTLHFFFRPYTPICSSSINFFLLLYLYLLGKDLIPPLRSRCVNAKWEEQNGKRKREKKKLGVSPQPSYPGPISRLLRRAGIIRWAYSFYPAPRPKGANHFA